MLISVMRLGEVWGDLSLGFLLLSTTASKKNTGAANAPPGNINIITPMIAGIHHFEFGVWAFWDSLLGIRVLEWGLGNKAYSTIGACAILAIDSTDALLSRLASIIIGLSLPSITLTRPLLTSSRKLVTYPR